MHKPRIENSVTKKQKLVIPSIDLFINDVCERHMGYKNKTVEELLDAKKIKNQYKMHYANIEFEAQLVDSINEIKEKDRIAKENDKAEYLKKKSDEASTFDYKDFLYDLLKQDKGSADVGETMFTTAVENARSIAYHKASDANEDQDDFEADW